MFEFSKSILDRMCFDENLFMKELRKLIIWSGIDKKKSLKEWCINRYGKMFGSKIKKAFKTTHKKEQIISVN